MHPRTLRNLGSWRTYERAMFHHLNLDFVPTDRHLAVVSGHPEADRAVHANIGPSQPLWPSIRQLASQHVGSPVRAEGFGWPIEAHWWLIPLLACGAALVIFLSRRSRFAVATFILLIALTVSPLSVPALAGHGSWTSHDLVYQVHPATGTKSSWAALNASNFYDLGIVRWAMHSGDQLGNQLIAHKVECIGAEACKSVRTETETFSADRFLYATMCGKDGAHVLSGAGATAHLLFECSTRAIVQHNHYRDV